METQHTTVFKAVPYVCGSSDTLVPFDDNRLIRSHSVYLHGEIEYKAGFDIFAFVDVEPTEEGIYAVEVLFPDGEVNAMLFMWKTKYFGMKGLCVADNDSDNIAHAKVCFIQRLENI